MRKGVSSSVRGYLWAALSVAAAVLIRLWMQPLIGNRVPYATLYGAVAMAAILGGTGPGILAVIGGGLFAVYFFVPPAGTFWMEGLDNRVAFTLYLCVSSLIVALSTWQRHTQASMMEVARLAEERRKSLESEILQRQLAEQAERLQRQWFEVTLASIGDAVIATDTQGKITFMNQPASRLTGWSATEAVGQLVQNVFSIRHEATGELLENPVQRAIQECRTVNLASHGVLVTRDRRRIAVDDSGAPIIDNSGNVLGAVLVFRDVTEARARENELRLRERLIDLSHDAVIMADADRRITAWNSGARELYGYTAEEARGRRIPELLKTRAAGGVAAIDAQLRETGQWNGELIHTTRDGREVISDSRQVLLSGPSGEPAGLMEINRDVTERRRAAEALQRAASEAEEGRRTLFALMEHIPEGIAIADAPDGRIRAVSKYALQTARLPLHSLINVPLDQQPSAWGILASDGKTRPEAAALPLARAILKGEVVTDEEWFLESRDAQPVPILCSAAPILDSNSRVTGGLFVWRDISHRKRLDQRLRDTAKLESLGVLAGGIAHDFNNLLTGILGNASLLLEDLPRNSRQAGYARAISRTAELAALLTNQMLAYSGRGRFVVAPLDLSAFIREIAALITASIPKNVDVAMQLAPGLPAVEADAAQLQQVLMNLIVNGAEAVGTAAGRVEIATRTVLADERLLQTISASEALLPGIYVVLEIRDTGCGMDGATLGRIFDPFFTTKFTGRGLGLAAVQGIVRGHRGAIHVKSTVGTGTTFTVYFPASPAPARTLAPGSQEREQLPQGNGTVMVVDDEEMVRSVAQASLLHLGYKVLLASGGSEALEMLAQHEGVDLVILDMTMPGLSGEGTLQRLRERNREVPVLLSSGFSEQEALERFGKLGVSGFLQKPYSVRTLAERVHKLTRTADARTSPGV